MERIGTELYGHLMRNGLQPRTVGAVKGSGKKEPGAADKSARRQLPAQGGAGGIGMAISRDRLGGRPQLMVIQGGRS